MTTLSLVAPRRFLVYCLVLAVLALGAPATLAQWVNFLDETSTRLNAPAGLGTNDSEEKDYAWGDLDNDGDTDLVVVRKQPFTSPGKRANLLLMNVNGVLTDQTGLYATNSDVPGDQGFNTPTNDRDVKVVDLNGDGWLDVVTATTISDGDPKHIGHPRIYINLGRDLGTQEWLGLRHEDGRMPTMQSYTGQSGFNPRFCSVDAADLTGDNRPDLWFGDYDSSGAGGNGQPSGADYNDRLLVNTGFGSFQDQTSTRFAGLVAVPGSADTPFEVSAFGAAANIADLNGDGYNDIIKQTSLNAPLYVGVAYNDPNNEGFFETYDVVNNQSPYFVSVKDLNRDGKLDMVITDDGADRYMINQGGGFTPAFTSFVFSYDAAGDDGFGGNSFIADLNNDQWNDVLITDVDVDISGCNRRMHIYRNLGGVPGDNVILQEQTSGSGCATSQGNPASCMVAGIPSNQLEGVHDVAVFDIDDNGWLDMVVGTCDGTQVWMNQEPSGLIFNYPLGLPSFTDPGQSTTFQVKIDAFGPVQHIQGTTKLFASVNGAGFSQAQVVQLADDVYEVTLPAAPGCSDTIAFYVTADSVGGEQFQDPSDAPIGFYRAVAAEGTETAFEDDVEGDVSGWTIVNDPSLSAGAWEKAEPNGTVTGGGQQAAPSEDGQGAQTATFAFVTENLPVPDGEVGLADVDGGPTDLISPPIDLAGTDANITYTRWFYSSGTDEMTVWVTSNGTTWLPVEIVPGNSNFWQVSSFRVGDYVTPSANVQVRFRAIDVAPGSIVEAGVDLMRVERFICSQQNTGAGRIPDGDSQPGQQLQVGLTGENVNLSWGASCQGGDSDYGVYRGSIGNFSSYDSVACSTAGSTSLAVDETGDNNSYFYLVVPSNGTDEGSYGDSSVGPRPTSGSACFPQSFEACQ